MRRPISYRKRFGVTAAMLLNVALAIGSLQDNSRGAVGGETNAVTDVSTIMPSTLHPFVPPADDNAARAELVEQVNNYVAVPAKDVTAHPAAADFPGAVASDAAPATRDLSFPTNISRWHSTGLYAAPGAKITIRVPASETTDGMSIVIGSHTDSLLKLEKWVRFPKISRRFSITQEVTTVANAFGGLIYVDIPRDKRLGGWQESTFGGYGWLDEELSRVPGSVQIRIEGALDAPLYVLGRTTPSQWNEQLEKCKVPWGELESDKIILTVESKHLSAAADPARLLTFWGNVIDAEALLAGWPAQPAPPERVVLDREISAGSMHSGYPIMAHLGSEHDLLNLPALQVKGNWGFFHEMGHNHEAQACTFGGDYVEVNVNLFSMYVMQNLIGRPMTAHPALANVGKLLDERLGPDHKTGPWNNLAMYIRTIQAFGWDSLQKTLASYATPTGSQGIKAREQKMDQWILRYSLATKQNLVAYYAMFDVTCSDQTKAALQGLPKWMPPELMKYSRAE